MEFLKKIVWFPAKSQIKLGRNPQVISEMSTVSPGKKEEGYSWNITGQFKKGIRLI